MEGEGVWKAPRRAMRGKDVTVLNQQVNEDVFKKMNFADRKQFCLAVDQELRTFVTNPGLYAGPPIKTRHEYRVPDLDAERRFLLYSIARLYSLNYIVSCYSSP